MKSRLTITAKDLRALVDLLDPRRVGELDEEFPSSFVEELVELVPCSWASFNMVDMRHQRGSNQDIAAAEAWEISPDLVEELTELFVLGYWEEGGCSYSEDTGDRTSVLRDSDLISDRDFAKTKMGEHNRRIGVRHEVVVPLPPLGLYERRLLLSRTGGRDFSDREVMLLTLLRPHLAEIHGRHRRYRAGTQDLTPRQRETLRLVAGGLTNTQIARTLNVSDTTVRKHLENIYQRLGVGTRTAAVAKAALVIDLA